MPTTINPKLISWASDIDDGTIDQAERTARLPFIEGHVALMPDAHVGIGATVGSVIPTTGRRDPGRRRRRHRLRHDRRRAQPHTRPARRP